MKRILSIVISAVMMLSLIPMTAFSVSAETDSQGLEYDISSNGTYYVVVDYDGESEEVVIPATFNGKPVKEIGEEAFYMCTDVTSIEIPNSVTNIGALAFGGCESLTDIVIPSSVTGLGDDVFIGCIALESITVASGNTVYKAIGNCLIEISTKTLLFGCKNSVIPDDGSVQTIGNNAFAYCSELTAIEIPDSVTKIAYGAFIFCENLESVLIPDSVQSISAEAFAYCSSLKSIEIPASVKYIGEWAFCGCSALESITVASGNPAFKAVNNCLIDMTTKTLLFGCKNSVIPDENGVKKIADWAFEGCVDLKSIEIPANITEIGYSAFYDCTGLESITVASENTVYKASGNCLIETESKTLILGCKKSVIPDDGSVEIIGTESFCGCDGLTRIEIPSTVTTISNGAFAYCGNLMNVVIPDSVTRVDDFAFDGCASLISVFIPDSVVDMGTWVFYGCENLTDIYCEAESIPNTWDEHWGVGCQATIHYGADVSDMKTYQLGDLDGDGDVDVSDYILVKRAVLKNYELTEQQQTFADIDKDGDVDATDYILVKRIVLGTFKL